MMAKCLEDTNKTLCTDLSPGVVTCGYKYADKIKLFFYFTLKLKNITSVVLNVVP